jgi:hypothetical protein
LIDLLVGVGVWGASPEKIENYNAKIPRLSYLKKKHFFPEKIFGFVQ